MAIIKCPECEKEISDKAKVCIHCGLPLEQETQRDINHIVSIFEEYGKKGYLNGRANIIYSQLVSAVNETKSKLGEEKGNNEIAKSIIDGLSLITNKVGWPDCKLFCELINFDLLSTETLYYFADKLFLIISEKHYYDDGSSGYTNITPFFYAEYMVLKNAPEEIKARYMEVLNQTHWGERTGFEHIMTLYNQHGNGNSFQQITNTNVMLKGMKCPMCSSANIKRITTMRRLFSVATFGLASSKIGKQYECKICKHMW